MLLAKVAFFFVVALPLEFSSTEAMLLKEIFPSEFLIPIWSRAVLFLKEDTKFTLMMNEPVFLDTNIKFLVFLTMAVFKALMVGSSTTRTMTVGAATGL